MVIRSKVSRSTSYFDIFREKSSDENLFLSRRDCSRDLKKFSALNLYSLKTRKPVFCSEYFVLVFDIDEPKFFPIQHVLRSLELAFCDCIDNAK